MNKRLGIGQQSIANDHRTTMMAARIQMSYHFVKNERSGQCGTVRSAKRRPTINGGAMVLIVPKFHRKNE